MGFSWVTINVKDMEESLAFYQEFAGLRINRKMSPVPETEIVFLGTEDSNTEVELIRNKKNDNPQYGRDISMGFTVDSVEETMKVLKSRGVAEIEGPFQPIPTIKFIFITDPNGLRIQLIENIS